MDDKYIELLLKRCVDLNGSNLLFICYDKEIKDFIEKLISKAYQKGIKEVYLDEVDVIKDYNILKMHTIEELQNKNFFDSSIWDEYASKKANFLIIETEQPHIMDDIETEKVALMVKKRRDSRPLYRKMVEHCELSWCIAAYPGIRWAKEMFPNSEDSYQKLLDAIYKSCMIYEEDPVSSWDFQLNRNDKIIKYLNSLSLTKLHYQNGLGTDLVVYLPRDYLFSSARDAKVIVNMPSYEVFTSPIYNKTKGIVYSSRPLSYGGTLIDKFWLKFEDGKVVDYDAELGKDILGSIIDADDNSCYLGECALVEDNSPISNLKLIFGTTLIDENASCHLALGCGFPECLKNGLSMKDEELLSNGINVSKTHVDFMIGTNDLKIVGTTHDNREILILENGNFSKEIIDNC